MKTVALSLALAPVVAAQLTGFGRYYYQDSGVKLGANSGQKSFVYGPDDDKKLTVASSAADDVRAYMEDMRRRVRPGLNNFFRRPIEL